jgi:hypothetical protein
LAVCYTGIVKIPTDSVELVSRFWQHFSGVSRALRRDL